jgi:hypothetical protein
MPERSQYAPSCWRHLHLVDGIDGLRPRIRQHWHIWEVMRDTSQWAATPALGYAARMISICVLLFLGLIAFIFWLGGLVEKPALASETPPASGRGPAPDLAPEGGVS